MSSRINFCTLDLVQIKYLVDRVFTKLRARNTWVLVLPTNLPTIAAAAGIRLNVDIQIINLHGITVLGFVFLNDKSLNLLSNVEMRFVLAHECAHIFEKHVLSTAIFKGH
ncbi:MAG: hypothetical protein DLM72_18285 [Candidatus Nitrosopolaris wilkensis]|nr:MAG: hypothetical protein DLM72_18285 [Candidatus Nitrosopolaris wilkensis]